jgi:hypothetical protein
VTPAPSPEALDRKTQLEIQKLEAEVQRAQTDRQKAELEILELKRWRRRPAVLQSIAAIVVAVVAAIIGTANGWFSTRLDSLKLEQEKVQRDIDDLNKGRSTLNAQIAILQAERDQLQRRLSDAGMEADRLSKTLSSLQIRAVEADRYKQDLRNLQQELAKVSDQAKAAAKRIPETNLVQMKGIVKDQTTRTGIEGASVIILNGSAFTAYTDSNGYFELSRPPNPDRFLIGIAKLGYINTAVEFTASRPGQPPTEIYLQRESARAPRVTTPPTLEQ